MDREFIIYLGSSRVVTVTAPGLSQVYRLQKAIPFPIMSPEDKMILLRWQQAQGGCASCGKGFRTRPIWSDMIYCQTNRLDLSAFRNEWAQKYVDLGVLKN